MKKIFAFAVVTTMMLSFTACGGVETPPSNNSQNISSSDNDAQTSTENNDIAVSLTQDANANENKTQVSIEDIDATEQPTIDTSWYSEDSSAICDGVYLVGKDIVEDNYIFTCTYSPYSTRITVFETQEKYDAYHKTSRLSHGEEDDAISANALSSEYVRVDEQYALNLKSDNVLVIDGGRGILLLASGGTIESANVITGKTMSVVTGTYQAGDIKSDTYMLTCLQSDYALKVVVFANKEAYDKYMAAEHFTNGEERVAIEQNAWSDFYIEPGESCYINVTDDNVLQFDGGTGQLESVDMSWENE